MFDAGTTLQSGFAVIALLSDWTLLFDQYLLSLPIPYRPAHKSTIQERWTATLLTCIIYAFAEPLCFGFMTSVSNVAMWWLLMASFVHFTIGNSGCVMIMSNSVFEAMKDHEEQCANHVSNDDNTPMYTDAEEKHQPLADVIETGEDVPKETGERVSTPGLESADATTQLLERAKANDFRSCPNHPSPWAYRLAPMLPTITAAATSAGLLFWVEYLATEDAQAWYNRFAFGYYMISGLCLFGFGMAKWNNRSMDNMVNPKHFRQVEGTAGTMSKALRIFMKLSNLVVLFFIRAMARCILGQLPLVSPILDDGVLRILSLLCIPDETSQDGQGGWGALKEHAFDRLIAKVPWWLGPVASSINLVFVLWLYLKQKRERRRGASR